MSINLTLKPKIITYWIGWTAETGQAYPQLQGIPDYVDVVTLAFALVQQGQVLSECLEVQCPPGSSSCPNDCTTQSDGTLVCQSTCLLDTQVDSTHTRANLKSWIADAKRANPNLKFLLSIGGARYCDWNSINDLHADDKAQAFAENVKAELALWNDAGQLLDGVDIDYEYADCCGSTLDTPQGPTIVDVIKAIAAVLPEDGILSVPIYGGSPSDLLNNLDALKAYITYACTMDYSCDLWSYSSYQPQVNWLAMGFQTPDTSQPSTDPAGILSLQSDTVTACFDSAASANPPVTLSSGMLWNLGNPQQTPLFLEQLNANLNQ